MKAQYIHIIRIMMLILSLGGISMIAAKDIHSFSMKSIDGKEVKLENYKGKVLLIVNTASKCGFTGQYEDLEELYKMYKDEGLVILGFPANDFLNQEPGSNKDIAEFCRLNYGVSFPMFEKISVKGKNIHPLYEFLTDKKTNPVHGGAISWNFNKFLISKDGKILDRFGSRTVPMDKSITSAIEAALK